MRSRSSVKVLGIESTIIISQDPFINNCCLWLWHLMRSKSSVERSSHLLSHPCLVERWANDCVEPEMPARAPRTESIKYKTCWAIIQSSLITLHSTKGDIKVQLRVYGTPSHHKPQDLNQAPRPWSQSCPECAPLNISLSKQGLFDYSYITEKSLWRCLVVMWYDGVVSSYWLPWFSSEYHLRIMFDQNAVWIWRILVWGFPNINCIDGLKMEWKSEKVWRYLIAQRHYKSLCRS